MALVPIWGLMDMARPVVAVVEEVVWAWWAGGAGGGARVRGDLGGTSDYALAAMFRLMGAFGYLFREVLSGSLVLASEVC